ncbi:MULTISPECIES: ribosomal protein S18-alanine N-acetyltransferase [unclassified Candidatus Frackibacter]|uniref:ribosomal protein S18-alanine N-acetyltransferase n=1 Tax=unclassified Candidatus Frackibacter TaxID=2648818 RepID=UPI000881DA1E|nr:MULTISPECIES: ribosomal protein S18-alanine N-acetyltransferase [unclassified Candidatus Frackibacter]SDC23711.1 [SSU ribosomal protein S18P]-alanine acetyltransferase [Candidatus Frackibacter sp. WG11]SEM48280.1 [SSU ribosomal protein S18P]-alanine acetyltransferase [Candidatus Frackibacter sp. WG12]SFL50190.1 [SSU ribosomal protein S18P]-alanine acetyltransferase [Candidatus Frackibacter sp. WG13]
MKETNNLDLNVEYMKTSDLDQVLVIEKEAFNSPWSRNAFKKEITKNRYANYFVAKNEQEVIGYIGAWIILNESHITTLAVNPDYRRQGVAKKLLITLFGRLVEEGVNKVTLEVRVSNQSARRLYTDYGFDEAGIRKNYYQDNKEDAVIMWKTLKIK